MFVKVLLNLYKRTLSSHFTSKCLESSNTSVLFQNNWLKICGRSILFKVAIFKQASFDKEMAHRIEWDRRNIGLKHEISFFLQLDSWHESLKKFYKKNWTSCLQKK